MTVPTVGRGATNLNPHHGTPNPRAFSLKTEVQMPRSIRSRVQRDLINEYQIGTRKANEVINWVNEKMGWPNDRPGYTRKALYGAASQRLRAQKIPLRVETQETSPKILAPTKPPEVQTSLNYQWLWEKLDKMLEMHPTPSAPWVRGIRASMESLEKEARISATRNVELEKLQSCVKGCLIRGPLITKVTEVGLGIDACWLHFSSEKPLRINLPIKEVKTILRNLTEEWIRTL
jgi:hypothetical protein